MMHDPRAHTAGPTQIVYNGDGQKFFPNSEVASHNYQCSKFPILVIHEKLTH